MHPCLLQAMLTMVAGLQSQMLQEDEFAEYARHMQELFKGPGRKREAPMLWQDRYRGRSLSLAQRLRSGVRPVLERDPTVTIDDPGKSSKLLTPASACRHASQAHGHSSYRAPSAHSSHHTSLLLHIPAWGRDVLYK